MTIRSMQKQAEQEYEESFQDDEFNEDDESKSRVLSRRGRGRPRKDNEIVLGANKEFYLGYKIEQGMYCYSEEQITEALTHKGGNITKTAKYLQVNPNYLGDRIRQSPSLTIARDQAKELFNDFVDGQIMDYCTKGDQKMLIWWAEHRGGTGNTNKNLSMNLNMNIDLNNLTVEELNDIRQKLLSTVNIDS